MDDHHKFQPSSVKYLSSLSPILEAKKPMFQREGTIKNYSNSYRRIKTLRRSEQLTDKNIASINKNSIEENNFIFNLKENLREEKFNLNQRGNIELAKIHSLANRPLKIIDENIEYDSLEKCACCGHYVVTPGQIELFNMCDDTDKYLNLGEAVSLYFSFYKFSIFIFIVALCGLIIPSFIIVNNYHYSINNLCKNIKDNNFQICQNFIKLENDNSTKSVVSFTSQLDAINMIYYLKFYNNIMNIEQNNTFFNNEKYSKMINKSIINNSFCYFIVLITLFLLNLLYIVYQNNKILDYNFRLISPSDYAILITNLSYTHYCFLRMKQKEKLSLKEFHKKLGFSKSELNDKKIYESMEFCEFIKKFVINKNEKYNVEMINICYKLDKFQELKEKADELIEYLYELDNYQCQIKRNKHLKLQGKRKIYFKYLLPFLTIDFCTKKIKITEILREKKNKEKYLNLILENSKHVTKDNFTNVVVVSFSNISEQEKFLDKYSQNFFEEILNFFKNFKYIVFGRFMSEKAYFKRYKEIDESIKVLPAPEPDDIIFENLVIEKPERILRIFFTTFISFLIIIISFIIVFLLTIAQERINEMSFGEKNFSKFVVSLGMTGAISVINILLQTILEILTKKEYQISLTDYNLSFSVKMTICTFLNSAIVPLISNIYANIKTMEINHDLLVSNMFTMFCVNSIVSPLMWTFNVGFYLKKLRIWKIEKKKNTQDISQKNLNELYEYIDIDLAYKYSYLSKTLLMTFFYFPLFPLGLVISMFGFILGFYLEKFNIGHRYKRPRMMNETICKFYTYNFKINFFMLALGDYIFLRDKYRKDYWQYINLSVFGFLIILPFGRYLNLNFLGINQSNIINKSYNDVYISFFIDYERMNPLTKKIGRINYLRRLKALNYLSEEEYQSRKKHIEKLSILQINLEANPTRITRSPVMRRDLLSNIGINESNSKAKRLFELIKKLYNSNNNNDNNFNRITNTNTNRLKYKGKKIPDILLLAGTIFGLEEEKKSPSNSFKEASSELSGSDTSDFWNQRAKTSEVNNNIFKNKLNKNKNKSPFIIKDNNTKNIYKEDTDENDIIVNENIINTNINQKLEDIKNNNQDKKINISNDINNQNNIINSKDNLVKKKEDYNSKQILSQIMKEIKEGKKNLLKYSDMISDKHEKKETNTSNKTGRNTKLINSTKMKSELTHTNSIPSSLPYISNISVTINQFFDKRNDNQNITSKNNILASNDTIIESEEEDNLTNNKFQLKNKNFIPLMHEDKDSDSNKRPFKNIINIVVNNDSNINNNNSTTNNQENKDKVVLNEYINIK